MSGEVIKALKVAVIGAGGFIGTNLVRHLSSKAKNVRALSRSNPFNISAANVEWFYGDFSDIDILKSVISGADIVIHLVTTSTPVDGIKTNESDILNNVLPTIRFLDICVAEGVKKVVYFSSGGAIYGNVKIVPTPEDAPTEPLTSYGVSKLMLERYLALYYYHHNLNYIVLRLANPYGPYQFARKGQGVIPAFLEKAIQGAPISLWGGGNAIRDFVFIDDVASAVDAAIEYQGKKHIFNIGSGKGISIKEVISELECLLMTKIQINNLGDRPTDLAMSVLDVSCAESEMGWAPKVDFQEGLCKTVNWWKETHKL